MPISVLSPWLKALLTECCWAPQTIDAGFVSKTDVTYSDEPATRHRRTYSHGTGGAGLDAGPAGGSGRRITQCRGAVGNGARRSGDDKPDTCRCGTGSWGGASDAWTR